MGENALTKISEVTTSPGAISVAVDPETHSVWIAFTQTEQPFVQELRAIL